MRTRYPLVAASMMGIAASIAIAKPMFSAEFDPAAFTPTTSPSSVTSGPPEFPGFSAASVWRASAYVLTVPVESCAVMVRSSELMMPEGHRRAAGQIERVAERHRALPDG